MHKTLHLNLWNWLSNHNELKTTESFLTYQRIYNCTMLPDVLCQIIQTYMYANQNKIINCYKTPSSFGDAIRYNYRLALEMFNEIAIPMHQFHAGDCTSHAVSPQTADQTHFYLQNPDFVLKIPVLNIGHDRVKHDLRKIVRAKYKIEDPYTISQFLIWAKLFSDRKIAKWKYFKARSYSKRTKADKSRPTEKGSKECIIWKWDSGLDDVYTKCFDYHEQLVLFVRVNGTVRKLTGHESTEHGNGIFKLLHIRSLSDDRYL